MPAARILHTMGAVSGIPGDFTTSEAARMRSSV